MLQAHLTGYSYLQISDNIFHPVICKLVTKYPAHSSEWAGLFYIFYASSGTKEPNQLGFVHSIGSSLFGLQGVFDSFPLLRPVFTLPLPPLRLQRSAQLLFPSLRPVFFTCGAYLPHLRGVLASFCSPAPRFTARHNRKSHPSKLEVV